jgi:glycine cleavage system H protein
MLVPDDLRYSTEHEWVRHEGGRARIGVTDYAQDALGDVVFVQLPSVGDDFAPGAVMGEVESTKSVSEIYSPVAGNVVAVNDLLAERPELVNQDPYGDGWFCEVEISDQHSLGELLDAEGYRSLTES